ncbi:hypothetical protein TNCV_4150971 [Trichonephila clavipes]|nr:hypothetical protein TNCV_4150971 [Trichonephila clavipes]
MRYLGLKGYEFENYFYQECENDVRGVINKIKFVQLFYPFLYSVLEEDSGWLRIHLRTAAWTLASWLHHYDPDNIEYRHCGSPSIKKFKTLMSATKVMLIIFLDANGVLYTKFPTERLTVNSDSAQTQDVMGKLKFTVVPQPPFNPDLAPSDFWLFPKLKETMKGQRFSTVAEVQAIMRKWIHRQPEYFCMDGMKK